MYRSSQSIAWRLLVDRIDVQGAATQLPYGGAQQRRFDHIESDLSQNVSVAALYISMSQSAPVTRMRDTQRRRTVHARSRAAIMVTMWR
jgi:hypothetical protein